MISSMREYFRGLKFILIIIVVAFVGTSVVYFGTSLSSSAHKPSVVATVNGEEIPVERFRRTQANLINRYEQYGRQRLTPELIDRLGINQQVISELVNDAVVVQAAAREGVTVSDDELRTRIQEMREFQEDGRFSRNRYLALLRQVRLDPGDFESELRRQLIRIKMDGLIRSGVKVSEPELRDAYAARHDRVRAQWASIDANALMATVTVADADVEPYLASHRAQFTRPERRRVQYVVVPAQPKAQEVSDVDAEAYYKEHADQYEQPRRVHIAHVLVRVPPVGGSEAENKAKAKVEDVLRRARAGEDFGKLAAEVSEDTANASQGGDLGYVGPGELVPQFEQAAFALKKGELVPAPVRTPFGYHAIKVLDIREASRTPFKDVAGKIKEKIAAERAERAARAKADDVRPQLISAADFQSEAAKLGLEARESTIGRNEPLTGIGRDPKVEDTIFSLSVGGVSTPVKSTTGYAVAKVVEQIPSGVPPLADIKGQVTAAIMKERADALAMDRAKALIASLAKGGDFSAAAKAEGFSTGETSLFSRDEPPKDKGLPGGAMMAALATPIGQISEPVRDASSVYVVKTVERQPADQTGFDAQRTQLEQQLLQQKQNQVWDSWLQSRRLAAKIDVNAQLSARTR